MKRRTETGLVGGRRQVDGVGIMIEGVKVLYFFAPAHVTGDDVGGLDRIGDPGDQLRIIRRIVGHTPWLSKAVAR